MRSPQNPYVNDEADLAPKVALWRAEQLRRGLDAAAISAAYNAAEELVALRAIIAGRTTPPTEAERETHSAAGGAWLVSYVGQGGLAAEVVYGWCGDLPCGAVYIALDARGLPCAWPVA